MHRRCEPHRYRSADDAMADVQFDQVGNPEKLRQILGVQSVTCIHADAEFVCFAGGVYQSVQLILSLLFAMKLFTVSTGVQLNKLGSDLGRGLNLC